MDICCIKNKERNGKGKEYNLKGKLKFEGEYLNGNRWNLIRKKIEDLKNLTGDDYEKIKENVEKIVLNLKLPDFYFDDDEDVERISDKEQKVDLDFKPILEAEFITLMRQ